MPENEARRVMSLRACDVLDTPADRAFDDLTRLATLIFGVPMSVVSLVDNDRQWFKSRVGVEACGSSRDVAFCAHSILGEDVFVVPDASKDPRFADNPLVTGPPYIRFYAGCPIRLSDGTHPGSMCAMDTVAHDPTPEQLEALRALARQAATLLEQRCLLRQRHEMAERLEAAIKASGQVLYDWDVISGSLAWYGDLRGLLGYEPGQLAEMEAMAAIVHPADLPGFEAEIERVRKTRTPFELNYRVRRRDGAWITLADRGYYVRNAREGGDSPDRRVVGFVRDVTEQLRIDSERRRLQAMLQTAVDAMPQRVFWKDKSGVYLGCNRAFAQDAGRSSPEEMIGTTDFDHPWRAHAAAYQAEDRAVMAAGEARLNYEESVTGTDGRERWLRTSKVPLRGDTGAIIGVLGTFEDTTAEREAKDELRRTRDEAEAASRAKSDFLANMSHEIRTPMTAILGFADLLSDPECDREQCVATIRRNGEHLLSVINDILDLSKIEAGRFEVRSEPVEPRRVVGDVLDLMRPRAQAKGLTLEHVSDDGVPVVISTDVTRLRQVLVNLVGNAIKFTESGGVRVEVRARDAEAPELEVRVADTGIGMDRDTMARLFQPFMQADTSLTRKYCGTGLGLTISKRLVELLGGRVMVSSAPGIGTTFTLTIPYAVGSVVATPEPLVVEAAPAPTLAGRVLLVEDGPDNQRLIAHYLKRAGATVDVVEHGRAGLERALRAVSEGSPYDLILMDMQMPVMDGYAATRELRRAGYEGAIVALTAHAMSQDRDKCIDAGCDDFCTKPIDRRGLIGVAAKWMAGVGASTGPAPRLPSADA